MRAILQKISEESSLKKGETSLTPLDMFRRGHATKTLILMLTWASAIVAYYALTLNVGDLAGDIFVNYCLAQLVDLPGFVLVFNIVDRFGT